MLRVTKITDYALVVLCSLANTPDKQLSSTEIAKIVNLQLPTVSKILKILVKFGLVISSRGQKGGYRLAEEPKSITVDQVITILEGPIALTDCVIKVNSDTSSNISNISNKSCAHIDSCKLQQPWQKINHKINTVLSKISIYDLIQ